MTPAVSSRSRRWVWPAVAGLAVLGLVVGAVTLFSWMVDETHFDRPDAGFDRLAAELEELPGVSVESTERWVEAPTFVQPTSWISLTVDQENLAGLLDAACSAEYDDTVTWSLRVRTGSGDVVSAHTFDRPVGSPSTPGAPGAPGSPGSPGSNCIDPGFDLAGLTAELDRVRPGLDLQAAIWDDGRFALVSLEEDAEGIRSLLPLVTETVALRDAAGLDPSRSVEINSGTLGVVIEPGELEPYHRLLTELVEEHGVESFWADDGGSRIDGIATVQLVAPEEDHAAIERAIRRSELPLADYRVRFLPSA